MKSLVFSFLLFLTIAASAQSDEYKKQRFLSLEEMREVYDSLVQTSPESVINFINKAMPEYKEDNVVLAWKYRFIGLYHGNIGNVDSNELFNKKSLETFEAHEDLYLYAICKAEQSSLYCNSGQLDKALLEIHDLEDQIDSNSHHKVLCLYYESLGGYYNYTHEKDKAIENFLLAIEQLKNSEDSDSKNNQMSGLYLKIGQLLEGKMAADYYKKARDLTSEEFLKHFCSISIVQTLGDSSSKQAVSDLRDAINYFNTIGHPPYVLHGKFVLANALSKKRSFKEAESLYLSVYAESHDINHIANITQAASGLGLLYETLNQYDKSIKYSLETIQLAPKKSKTYSNALRSISNVYRKKKDYQNANVYLEKYFVLQDSSRLEERQKVVLGLEKKFATEKKEHQIQLLKTQNELDNQHQRSQRNMLIGGIIFTTLAGIFFFMLYRNRQKTNLKLQELDATKSRFFENISHEFRTPLTLIKLPISMALKSNEPLTNKQLNTVHNNASRLQNLIEDLLTLSELEAEQMIVNQTEQNPFQQTIIIASQFDSYAESKGITYEYAIENKNTLALYDKKVVEKVLNNLISNAIKYSNPGSKVKVEANLDNFNLVMKVADNGNGIAPENQDKVFDRFYQVDEKDEGNQGSGIGLALVKKLLELNGGSISLESKMDQGSIFIASLPLENIKNSSTEMAYDNTLSTSELPIQENILDAVKLSNKPQLLLVEDNKELLQFIKEFFEEDYEIHTSIDGQDGWDKAQKIVPDFIISDWMMPKMSGIELCKMVKTNTVTSHIPFLLLTAKSDVKNKVEGYETGADSYFSKPFNFEELQAQIKNLIDQRRMLYQKYSDSGMPTNISSNAHDIKFWESFKSHIKHNLADSDLSAQSVADAMDMSRMQLHRKLTALTGQTISTIIKNQRMILATNLLEDPKNRISEICYAVGFKDNSSFSRTFKKEYGMSPTLFRENLKN
ncbi:MAG: hypothetical protein COA58_13490 [Bacteroidetes bacterium]|nr:MAG: hypothetical protein COA58_13490 [Bacteroidota bacterium]